MRDMGKAGWIMQKNPRYGHVDLIKDGYISGWAIDAFRGDRPASLFLFIDDGPVANFFCDTDRADLESAGLRSSNSGFRFAIPEQYLNGEPHAVSIRFHSGEYLLFSDREGGIANSSILRMHPPVTLRGYVDGLKHGTLRGWAVRQDHGSAVKQGGVDIAVLHDGVEVGRARGDKLRADQGAWLRPELRFCVQAADAVPGRPFLHLRVPLGSHRRPDGGQSGRIPASFTPSGHPGRTPI